MKYIITGLHSSGKQELCAMLQDAGVKCGKLFTNDPVSDIRYEMYSNEDITSIFENKAYVFIKEHDEMSPNSYEGLSLYEWDNNDVFLLSPDQFNSLNVSALDNDICVIWLDNNTATRRARYDEERRDYDWALQESVETRNIDDFIKTIYNTKKMQVVYFNNEDLTRVFGVIQVMLKHPDTVSIFSSTFN